MDKFPETYKSTSLDNGKALIKDVEFPLDKLKDNSLVVKPSLMGICRADVKEVTSSRDIPEDRGPLFGHEFIGKVVFAGKLTGFKEGTLVTFNPNVTPKRTTGFAEYFFIEGEKLEEAVIPIPDNLAVEPPWLAEPFACIIHSVKKLQELTKIEDFKDKKVGIIGAGNSGILFGWYTMHLGAEVHLFNRGSERITFIRERSLFENNEVSLLNESGSFLEQFDFIILVPSIIEKETLEIGVSLVKPSGYIHLYGGTRDGDRFLESDLNIDIVRRQEKIEKVTFTGKDLRITGAYGCGKEDFEDVFRLLQNNPSEFPLTKMVSKEIVLTKLPVMMDDLSSGKVDYPGKIIVRPN